ncbi:hypothetical protein [Flagellimonas flava]|uniref:hypothetical protein n=1 Tax=Flagellimonas flava TaxID=570519 RepID=UPI003D648928
MKIQNYFKRIVIVWFIGLILVSCNQKASSSKDSNIMVLRDSLTMEVNNLLKQGYINGFGVAIVNDDTTLYAQGFGLS